MVSYFRVRFVSAYIENALSIKASPILQLTESTVPSHWSNRDVWALPANFLWKITNAAESLGVSQVRAAVRINVSAKTFLRDVTQNKMGTEV